MLSQVLNDYDLETNDFYRWTVQIYSLEEISLSQLQEKLKIDFGQAYATLNL